MLPIQGGLKRHHSFRMWSTLAWSSQCPIMLGTRASALLRYSAAILCASHRRPPCDRMPVTRTRDREGWPRGGSGY